MPKLFWLVYGADCHPLHPACASNSSSLAGSSPSHFGQSASAKITGMRLWISPSDEREGRVLATNGEVAAQKPAGARAEGIFAGSTFLQRLFDMLPTLKAAALFRNVTDQLAHVREARLERHHLRDVSPNRGLRWHDLTCAGRATRRTPYEISFDPSSFYRRRNLLRISSGTRPECCTASAGCLRCRYASTLPRSKGPRCQAVSESVSRENLP
jgi:hypothetical protein